MEDPKSVCERARVIRAARRFYEPVEYLEALVALRLLAHEDIEPDFEDAANEWLFREWGWGAHLSEEASRRLLVALTDLLLHDPEPPYDTKRLLTRLQAVEDRFAGIPRVPTTQGSFLSQDTERPLVAASTEMLLTPCFGGALAWTYRSTGGVLGTLSRFPLMPSLPLSRQERAYPVLFWQDPFTHGFLKWRVSGEQVLELPGQSDSQEVLALPQTHAIQREGEALVLRLYRVAPWVTRIEDRWESRGQDRLAVRCLPLVPGLLATDRFAVAEGALPSVFVTLWALSLEGEITQAPNIQPVFGLPSVPRPRGEEALDIAWELPGGLWQVRVDPLEKEPLCERETTR